MPKRSVSQRCLDPKAVEAAGGKTVRQLIVIKQGIETETAKKIVKAIKDSKLKVQASIQGDELRVTGKNRDDLQAAIAFMRKDDYGIDLQFINFRECRIGNARISRVCGVSPRALDRGRGFQKKLRRAGAADRRRVCGAGVPAIGSRRPTASTAGAAGAAEAGAPADPGPRGRSPRCGGRDLRLRGRRRGRTDRSRAGGGAAGRRSRRRRGHPHPAGRGGGRDAQAERLPGDVHRAGQRSAGRRRRRRRPRGRAQLPGGVRHPADAVGAGGARGGGRRAAREPATTRSIAGASRSSRAMSASSIAIASKRDYEQALEDADWLDEGAGGAGGRRAQSPPPTVAPPAAGRARRATRRWPASATDPKLRGARRPLPARAGPRCGRCERRRRGSSARGCSRAKPFTPGISTCRPTRRWRPGSARTTSSAGASWAARRWGRCCGPPRALSLRGVQARRWPSGSPTPPASSRTARTTWSAQEADDLA